MDTIKLGFVNDSGTQEIELNRQGAVDLIDYLKRWLEQQATAGEVQKEVWTQLPGETSEFIPMDEVDARVAEHWEWVHGVPFARFTPECLCGSKEWIYRSWRWHQRPSPRRPYRVDVRMKCTQCSLATMPFGVVVPEDQPYLNGEHSRRQVLAYLKSKGYFEGSQIRPEEE